MAQKFTAAQRRYNENALLIAALTLIFQKLFQKCKSRLFGSIAETTSGGTPLRNISHYYDGNIPWMKSGELNDGIITEVEEFITQEGLENSSAKIFPKGTLVVALYGATVGKTGILGLDTASNQAVCAVFPKPEIVLTEFLFWFLRYKRPEFLGSSFGGAQPNISQKLLRETEVPVPPKDLQEIICKFLKVVENRQNGDKSSDYPILPDELADIGRIVACIEALAARVAEAQSLRREADAAADSLLYSALNSIFSKSSFPQKTIGELCITTSGGTPSRTRADFFEGNIPWIKSGELEDGFIYRAEEHITEEAVASSSAKIFPKGTLVVALYGATVGKTGVLEIDAATNQAVCALFPQSTISRDYLWWFLRSKRPDFLKSSFGGAQPNISQKVVRETEIPVPPLEEQQRLVAYLNGLQAQVSALRAAQSATQKELDALMPSILDKAFKGEL